MTDPYDPTRARLLWADGVAQTDARRLVPGEFVAVLTLGSRGDVIVPHSQPEHARAYFDGTTLFVRSVVPEEPVFMEGEAIGSAWTPVPFPCVLMLGKGRLVYEPLLRDESPHAWQPKWQEHTVVTDLSRLLPPACQTLEPAPKSKNEAGATPRSSPLLTLVRGQGDAPAASELTSFALAADPATVAGPGPNSAAVRQLLACIASEMPNAASAEAAEPSPSGILHCGRTRRSRLRAFGVSLREHAIDDFRRSGRSSRIVLLGLPVICYLALSPELAPAPSVRNEHRPATARPESAPITEPAGASSRSSTPKVQPPTPIGDELPVRPGSVEQTSKRGGSNQPTLEARAADAADRGAYAQAAGLYDQLASRHPDQPKFVSAARIFRARANENTDNH